MASVGGVGKEDGEGWQGETAYHIRPRGWESHTTSRPLGPAGAMRINDCAYDALLKTDLMSMLEHGRPQIRDTTLGPT